MTTAAQGIRIRHRGREPQVHPSAYVAPTATLVGDVRVGPRARVMYGAVLDAEGSRVEIGEAASICENAVLRASAVAGDQPVVVGALVHARTVLPDEFFVPPHTVALHTPVRLLAAGDPGLAEAVARVGFAQVAFGVDAGAADRLSRYERVAEVRAAEFAAHADDGVLEPGP
ncbi:gamma carbonic anhydrase family protein [Streptomyces zhihengii]